MGLFDKDFGNLFESAYTDIRKGRIARVYVLGEDTSKETVCIRHPDGRLYDTEDNLLDPLIESKYEYMITNDILLEAGTLSEGSFNTDDVLGLELWVISDSKSMYDPETGAVADLVVAWTKSQDYMNFYFPNQAAAKKAIRGSSLTGSIKAIPIRVQPHLIKKVKGMNPEIKKLLKYHADDIKAGLDKY